MDNTPLITNRVDNKYRACTRTKIIELSDTVAYLRPDTAGSTHPPTGSIVPTPNATASTSTAAIEYSTMHPIAMSTTPTTTMGTDLAPLDTQAVTGLLAPPTYPHGQPNVPGFNFMAPMNLGPYDLFSTSLDHLFNPGMLPVSYNGGSGVLPPRAFQFDPIESTTFPLLPPDNGDGGPTPAASTTATHSLIASAGRKRTHPQELPQVDRGPKRHKGSNSEYGP
jgi:hypothetical protein